MLENWDQNLGRKQGNHKYGGIFETRNREGQWKIISVKAKFEVIGVDKASGRKEKEEVKRQTFGEWTHLWEGIGDPGRVSTESEKVYQGESS